MFGLLLKLCCTFFPINALRNIQIIFYLEIIARSSRGTFRQICFVFMIMVNTNLPLMHVKSMCINRQDVLCTNAVFMINMELAVVCVYVPDKDYGNVTWLCYVNGNPELPDTKFRNKVAHNFQKHLLHLTVENKVSPSKIQINYVQTEWTFCRAGVSKFRYSVQKSGIHVF